MTESKKLDVTAIGNAIVDVLAQADDALLAAHNLPKGAMNLIDADAAERLYAIMGAGIESSGGSAGNTIAGIAALGGRCAYIGKVADDQLGQVFMLADTSGRFSVRRCESRDDRSIAAGSRRSSTL